MAKVIHCAFRSTVPAGEGVTTILASSAEEAAPFLAPHFGEGSTIIEHEEAELVCISCGSPEITHCNRWGRLLKVACTPCAEKKMDAWEKMLGAKA